MSAVMLSVQQGLRLWGGPGGGPGFLSVSRGLWSRREAREPTSTIGAHSGAHCSFKILQNKNIGVKSFFRTKILKTDLVKQPYKDQASTDPSWLCLAA